MSKRSFFTTFEISQICEVNPTTVQNWVKGKKLRAYSTPGGHRRVRREDLVAFMREFGLPIPRELEPRLVLIVDDEREMLDLLSSELGWMIRASARTLVVELLDSSPVVVDVLHVDLVYRGLGVQ